MKITTWMLITSLARFPSIITSTMGGNALGTKEYIAAVIIFAATVIISAAGLLVYKKISSRKHANEKESEQQASASTQSAANCSRPDENNQPPVLKTPEIQKDKPGSAEGAAQPQENAESPSPGHCRPKTNSPHADLTDR